MDDLHTIEFDDLKWLGTTPGYFAGARIGGTWRIIQPGYPRGPALILADRTKPEDLVRYLRDKGTEAILFKIEAVPVR